MAGKWQNGDYAAIKSLLDNDMLTGFPKTFATSILTFNRLSDKQQTIITRIISEAVGKQPTPVVAPAAPVVDTVDVSNIFTMFKTAKKALKFPKITLQTDAGLPIRITIGRNDDILWLNNPQNFYDSYGSIGANGHYWGKVTASSHKADIMSFMTKFNADPIGTAVAYGKLTNQCCFCHTKLTTPESLAAGYGPTCAKSYGLVWGKAKVSSQAVLDGSAPAFVEPVLSKKTPVVEREFGPLDMDLAGVYTEDDYVHEV